MKKKSIFLISFILMLSIVSGTICSLYDTAKEHWSTMSSDEIAWELRPRLNAMALAVYAQYHPDEQLLILDKSIPKDKQMQMQQDFKNYVKHEYKTLTKEKQLRCYVQKIDNGKATYSNDYYEHIWGSDIKGLQKKSQFYGEVTYDEKGNVHGTNDLRHVDLENVNIQDYMYASVRDLEFNIYDYGFDDSSYNDVSIDTLIQVKQPKNISIAYAIPKDIKESDTLISSIVNSWQNYGAFSLLSLLGGSILMAFFLLFYPIAIVETINPFHFFKKVKLGINIIIFGTVITFGAIGITVLSGVSITGILTDLLASWNLGNGKTIVLLANFIGWMLLLLVVSIALFLIKYICTQGIVRYMKENTLISSFVRKLRNGLNKLAEVDIKDAKNRQLFLMVLIQLAILTICCAFWGFGMLLLVVYSIVLFFWLRKHMERIQTQYDVLLNQTHQLSEGNFDVDMKEDVGVFNSLRDEFSNIRNGFEKAVQEETRSQNMKTELISNVSHDLKTPLTGIRNYVELLQQENLSEEQRMEYTRILDQYANRLHLLIEDLFEVSKATSGNIQLEYAKLDVVALLEQVYAECSDQLEEHHLSVIWNLPQEEAVTVWLDGNKTCRIFENLFGNVAKYALEHTRVYVDMKLLEHMVQIEVKNISREPLNFDSEEIMERFVRGDKSRHEAGSGLGLAIIKSFTEAMKGSFHIETDGDLFKAVISFAIYEGNDASSEAKTMDDTIIG